MVFSRVVPRGNCSDSEKEKTWNAMMQNPTGKRPSCLPREDPGQVSEHRNNCSISLSNQSQPTLHAAGKVDAKSPERCEVPSGADSLLHNLPYGLAIAQLTSWTAMSKYAGSCFTHNGQGLHAPSGGFKSPSSLPRSLCELLVEISHDKLQAFPSKADETRA